MAEFSAIRYAASVPMKTPILIALAVLNLALTNLGLRWAAETGTNAGGANTPVMAVICASIFAFVVLGIVAIAWSPKRAEWPRRVWKTADGETFETSDLAVWHQQRIERERQSGGERMAG